MRTSVAKEQGKLVRAAKGLPSLSPGLCYVKPTYRQDKGDFVAYVDALVEADEKPVPEDVHASVTWFLVGRDEVKGNSVQQLRDLLHCRYDMAAVSLREHVKRSGWKVKRTRQCLT